MSAIKFPKWRTLSHSLWILAITISFWGCCIPHANAQSAELSSLLPSLLSDQWPIRAAAAKKIVAMPDYLQSQTARTALIDLLDRENKFHDGLSRDYVKTHDASKSPGEGYSDYYFNTVANAGLSAADLSNRHHLEVLAEGWYVSWSQYAQRLATAGQLVVPIALQLAQSDLPDKRDNALSILSLTVEKNKLPSVMVAEIKQALAKGALDENDGVRWTAVKALGRVGDRSHIALLQQVAQSDPAADNVTSRPELKFPIRTEAKKSIDAIQKRK